MTTVLTPVLLPTAYATAPVSRVMTTTDGAGSFVCDGMTFLIAVNTNAGPQTVSITSSAAPITGRTGDIVNDPIASGQHKIYQIFSPSGWPRTIVVTVSNVQVTLAACRIAPTPRFGGVN